MITAQLDRDIEIIEESLSDWSNIEITHKYGDDRRVGDFIESVNEVIAGFIDITEGIEFEQGEHAELAEENKEMRKHIAKLEKMLDRRNAQYKRWEDD